MLLSMTLKILSYLLLQISISKLVVDRIMPKPIVLTACICIVAVFSSELVIAQAPLESSMIHKNVDGRNLRIDCTRPADWKSTDQRAAVAFLDSLGWFK